MKKRKLLNEVTNTRIKKDTLSVEKGHITTDSELYMLNDIVFSDREVFLLDDYQIEIHFDSE